MGHLFEVLGDFRFELDRRAQSQRFFMVTLGDDLALLLGQKLRRRDQRREHWIIGASLMHIYRETAAGLPVSRGGVLRLDTRLPDSHISFGVAQSVLRVDSSRGPLLLFLLFLSALL